MMVRLLVMVGLIGITVALTDWLRSLQRELQRPPVPAESHTPDYAFQGILLTVMGVDGEPRYRIEAPRMTHFLRDDRAEALSPHVWFHRDAGPPVELRSDRARLAGGGERLWLLGEVDIMRPPYAGRPRLTVQTRDVIVHPEPRRALTHAPVVAVSGDQRLAGIGMKLDLGAGTLDLESRVRGTYVP